MLPRVSIRAPLRRATAACAVAMMFSRFQSAPPCGERLATEGTVNASTRFNPRPPAESDGGLRGRDDVLAVSIRAPLRRATPVSATRKRLALFQSAPPCGERPRAPGWMTGEKLFQSAPPCGERRPRISVRVTPGVFQSAPPCGERPSGTVHEDLGRVFQSAPPCGERPCTSTHPRIPPGFNPRPPAESDLRTLQTRLAGWTFQSAPPCGERRRPARSR